MNQLQPYTYEPQALTKAELDRIREYADATVSDKTKRDYASAWRDFEAFCRRRGFQSLPASPEVIAAYTTTLADAGASISQIDMKRAAIRFMHGVNGMQSPTEHPQVIALMKGIRRTIKTAHTPKDELTLDQLRQIMTALPDDLKGRRDRAMLLMGFWGAFRRSELVAVEVSHVKISKDTMRITVPHSKGDQEGKGAVKTLPRLPDALADVCPVRAYRAWIDAAGIRSGLVFRPIDRWGNVEGNTKAMDGKAVARLIKRAVSVIGLEARQFAGHSVRRGFLTEATDGGAQSADMREQSGHKSDETLKLYQAQRGRGALRAVDAIVRKHLGDKHG